MISADTSSLIAFLAGEGARDTDLVEAAIGSKTLVLSPPVVSELLSFPQPLEAARALVRAAPMLGLQPELWERAAESRRKLLTLGRKARLADALVAQSCIDADVPLIARDRDFQAFADHCGLRLA